MADWADVQDWLFFSEAWDDTAEWQDDQSWPKDEYTEWVDQHSGADVGES